VGAGAEDEELVVEAGTEDDGVAEVEDAAADEDEEST